MTLRITPERPFVIYHTLARGRKAGREFFVARQELNSCPAFSLKIGVDFRRGRLTLVTKRETLRFFEKIRSLSTWSKTRVLCVRDATRRRDVA